MSVVPLSSVKGPILEDCQTLEEKGDWLSLVQTQQMVRVTVLEVANAAPAQVEAYRREVLELKELIQSYRSDVQALRAAQSQSSTASNPVAPSSPSTESLPASEEGVLVLQAQFETPPKDFWYEGKPFPRFAVRLCTAAGEPWERADVRLAVTMKNGRGLAEERCAKKAGPLLAGETAAVVDGAGVAAWESLRVCEPSSKHYGSFTMVVRAVEAPQGVRVAELETADDKLQVKTRVLRSGAGAVTSEDVMLASVSNAIVIGFNSQASRQTADEAAKANIELKEYSVVYDALDEIKAMMDKLIRPPPSKQLGSIVGTADVLQTFKIADVGKVAGCRLLDGYIRVGCNIRILRGNLIVYEGKLRSLRSVKSVVEQVDAPNECGVSFDDYQGMEVDDRVEVYLPKEGQGTDFE